MKLEVKIVEFIFEITYDEQKLKEEFEKLEAATSEKGKILIFGRTGSVTYFLTHSVAFFAKF